MGLELSVTFTRPSKQNKRNNASGLQGPLSGVLGYFNAWGVESGCVLFNKKSLYTLQRHR